MIAEPAGPAPSVKALCTHPGPDKDQYPRQRCQKCGLAFIIEKQNIFLYIIGKT